MINDFEVKDLKGYNIDILFHYIVFEDDYRKYNWIKIEINVDKRVDWRFMIRLIDDIIITKTKNINLDK